MASTDQLFAKISEGVYAVDANRVIVYWNQAAEKILGYTTEQAVGCHCWELLQSRDLNGELHCADRCEVRALAESGASLQDFDVMVRHADGHEVPIRVLPLYTNGQGDGALLDDDLLHLFHCIAHVVPEPKPELQIRFLGGLRVTRADGSQVGGNLWQRVKVRALLAALIEQCGRPLSRDELVELLWPDLLYRTALRNLNTTVYNLRRSLEPELKRGSDSKYVIYEGGQYSFTDSGHYWLDVDAFVQGVQRARSESTIEQRLQCYEQCLALYQGDYLSDLRYTEVWSHSQHLRLQALYLNATEELAYIYFDLGRHQEAEELYLQALTIDPYRESAVRQLFDLLLQRGRRAEAISRYEQWRTSLRDELDVEPSDETRAAIEAGRLPQPVSPIATAR